MQVKRRQESRSRCLTHAALFAAACGFFIGAAGCRAPLQWPWLGSRDDHLGRDLASIDDIRGPLQRILQARHQQQVRNDSSLTPPEGLEEYEQAKGLYEQREIKRAEKRFKQLAKNYPDSPVAEDALFMVGECQFHRKRYPLAQDSFARLLKEYPSTRHLSETTRRMFEIARIWLESPKIVSSGEIEQVDFEAPLATSLPASDGPRTRDPSRIVPVFPNLFDRVRPVFDTEGRALEALRSIWLNDPTGPLADDALMLSASYYLRKGNFEEADHIYDTLREEYPKSEHFENALILGSHTKLMSYQGPLYEDTNLIEAQNLKESALRLFPNHPERERLLDEIRKIEQERARGEWEMVRFWQKKNKPHAVAVYCESLIENHPNSTFAAQARDVLAEIDPEIAQQLGGDYDNDAASRPYEEEPYANQPFESQIDKGQSYGELPHEEAADDASAELVIPPDDWQPIAP